MRCSGLAGIRLAQVTAGTRCYTQPGAELEQLDLQIVEGRA